MSHAVASEIPRAAHNLKFFADFMEQQGGEVYPMEEAYINYTRYEPVGVAGLITPWNVPFMLTTWKLGPCLAAGNTAVIKPAEMTPIIRFSTRRNCKRSWHSRWRSEYCSWTRKNSR